MSVGIAFLSQCVIARAQGPLAAHLCAVAKSLTHLEHVSICLQTEVGLTSLEGSDPVAIAADKTQNLWGVGPSLSVLSASEAHSGGVLFVEDVTTQVDPRWPMLGELSTQLGVTAIYAFTLRSGGAVIGVITGYSQQAVSLANQQLADGLVLATIVTEVLLGVQAINHSTDHGVDRIHTDPVLDEILGSFPASSLVMHQAAGMLAERLHIGIVEAQIRLRALAFRRDNTLEELSRQIIADIHIPELEA